MNFICNKIQRRREKNKKEKTKVNNWRARQTHKTTLKCIEPKN